MGCLLVSLCIYCRKCRLYIRKNGTVERRPVLSLVRLLRDNENGRVRILVQDKVSFAVCINSEGP
jgi:hypothetical protein